MLKISNAVKTVLYSSDIALLALDNGWLNLSAYAESIKRQVESLTKKPVKTGSIVVALSRLKPNIPKNIIALPKIIIEELTVKADLVEVVYDKTDKTLENLAKVYKSNIFKTTDYLTVTQGIGEVAIMLQRRDLPKIRKIYIHRNPKHLTEDLVSLTIRVSPEYIYTLNTFYALTKKFTLKQLNIVNIISTYTEMAFIVESKNLEAAFLTLNELFTESKR